MINEEHGPIELIDLVVAFPGGPGTADMVRRARAAGIKVLEVDSGDRGVLPARRGA